MSEISTEWTAELRAWQHQAARAFLAHPTPDFLINAATGAGKSLLGAHIAHTLLQAGEATRVVVLCPTRHVARQWSQTMDAGGIALDAGEVNRQGGERRGAHGFAATYAAVAAAPDLHRERCDGRRTILICDEPHHLADNAGWGAVVHAAYGHDQVVRRLLLTGTPFRTDGTAIPWVTYGPDGVTRPDFTYDYAAASRDRICRPITVHAFNGEMNWESGDREYTATFEKGLPSREWARRYRTALQAGEWLPSILTAAHDRLQAFRATEPGGAGGLVVAETRLHARRIAAMLRELTGERPAVALSDDRHAGRVITRFADDHSREWLVAVRMVSEGVDIPRLRVGVYASPIKTDMYLRQVIGRFVRYQKSHGGEQRSWLYAPADPDLLRIAHQLEVEAPAAVRLRHGPPTAATGVTVGAGGQPGAPFRPLQASAGRDAEQIDYGSEEFTAVELAVLGRIAARHGLTLDPVALGRAGWLAVATDDDRQGLYRPEPPAGYARTIEEARAERARLVAWYGDLAGEDHQTVNGRLARRFGNVRAASVRQLADGNAHLRRQCEELYRERHSIPDPATPTSAAVAA